jgi:hypothetical protein
MAIYVLGGWFTTVRFDEERIDVQVEDGLVHVHGLYHYLNTSRLPALLTLSTPFPIDADHPLPKAFVLTELSKDGRAVREFSLGGSQEAPRVRLQFRPREGKWLLLDYWQTARVAEGCYILTTTRAWGRPIDHASFRLRLPAGYQLNQSNYPVIQVPGPSPSTTYAFSVVKFYPDHDWKFSWQAKQPASADPKGGAR